MNTPISPGWELLLLRHGIAEERSPDRPDAGRALTEAGRRRTRAVLERAVALQLTAQRLVSSPLTRALQTAELAVGTALAGRLEVAEALAPGADPFPLLRSWWAAASGQPPERLLLVGHEPDLGLLAARLIGAEPGAITLKKAGLALLQIPDPATTFGGKARQAGATLRLLLSPRVLLG
jgi:phosphohistidine phosphatase